MVEATKEWFEMIFDCVIYSGESELLISRVNYLSKVCDRFIVVEGTTTFSKIPRVLDQATKLHLQNKYGEKILWTYYSPSDTEDPGWPIESSTREHIKTMLVAATAGDLVLISDVDEIPSIAAINEMNSVPGIISLSMEFHKYDLCLKSSNQWMGTIGFKFESTNISIQDYRMMSVQYWLHPDVKIIQGGWHLSGITSVEGFKKKIMSFSHLELNRTGFNSRIYLSVIKYLGISITGDEVYEWNSNQNLESILNLSCKKHYFKRFRHWLGIIIRPIIARQFKKFIGELSIPEKYSSS